MVISCSVSPGALCATDKSHKTSRAPYGTGLDRTLLGGSDQFPKSTCGSPSIAHSYCWWFRNPANHPVIYETLWKMDPPWMFPYKMYFLTKRNLFFSIPIQQPVYWKVYTPEKCVRFEQWPRPFPRRGWPPTQSLRFIYLYSKEYLQGEMTTPNIKHWKLRGVG